jgi:hypothetical protein
MYIESDSRLHENDYNIFFICPIYTYFIVSLQVDYYFTNRFCYGTILENLWLS